MKNRILLLNQTFYPDHAATSQQLTDLAVELVKTGYSVDAIADIRSWDNRDVILSRYEIYRGVRIFRVGSSGFGKKTHFHRGLDYLTFNLSLIRAMFQLPRYDYIIGLTSPPWISFFGAVLGRYTNTPFIHWAMDVNPDEAVKLGWVTPGSLFHHFLEFTTKFTYQKSAIIIALDGYMAQLIKDKSKSSGISNQDDKVSVIPPWAHDDIKSIPHDANLFRKQNGLDGKFVIMYSGNFSVCHPLDTLLNAAQSLKDNKDTVFMFIGGGVRLNEILKYKEDNNLKNITCLPYQNREDIKYSLSAADLHIVSMGDMYVGIVHPSKIYGILQTGRPFILIGPQKSHIGDIIKKHNIGNQVDHGDVKKLTRVIRDVKSLSADKKNEIKIKCTNLAQTRYSRQKLTKKFIDECIKK